MSVIFDITHTTHYRFAQPVQLGEHRVLFRPRDSHDLRVLATDLAVTPEPIDMLVGFSHERAGAAMAGFLRERGYRRPAIVTGDDRRADLRRIGFEQAWGTRGALLPVHRVPAPTTLGAGRSALARLLDAGVPIDALACSSDVLAHGVIIEAQARGLRVPQDLGVIGFGDLAFARDSHPAITTIRIDGTAIGRQAALCIVERAEGRAVASKVMDLGFSVVARDSA